MKNPSFRFLLLILFASFFVASRADAKLLPLISFSSTDWSTSSSQIYQSYLDQKQNLAQQVDLSRLEESFKNHKIRLSQTEKKIFPEWKRLNDQLNFWQTVVDLQSDLVALFPDKSSEAVSKEADLIAKKIILCLYELSQKYRVGHSALFNNFLINTGVKKEGFCYHYVDSLQKTLSQENLKEFDLHWGVAWKGTYRENNAFVITRKGSDFKTGIAVDAWRHAGAPFWTKVEGDRFPWSKLVE